MHVGKSQRSTLIEEFNSDLIYLPGVNNVVADCLSRLEYYKNNASSDHFVLDKEDKNKYPLSYKIIMKYQQKDNELLYTYLDSQR